MLERAVLYGIDPWHKTQCYSLWRSDKKKHRACPLKYERVREREFCVEEIAIVCIIHSCGAENLLRFLSKYHHTTVTKREALNHIFVMCSDRWQCNQKQWWTQTNAMFAASNMHLIIKNCASFVRKRKYKNYVKQNVFVTKKVAIRSQSNPYIPCKTCLNSNAYQLKRPENHNNIIFDWLWSVFFLTKKKIKDLMLFTSDIFNLTRIAWLLFPLFWVIISAVGRFYYYFVFYCFYRKLMDGRNENVSNVPDFCLIDLDLL